MKIFKGFMEIMKSEWGGIVPFSWALFFVGFAIFAWLGGYLG